MAGPVKPWSVRQLKLASICVIEPCPSPYELHYQLVKGQPHPVTGRPMGDFYPKRVPLPEIFR